MRRVAKRRPIGLGGKLGPKSDSRAQKARRIVRESAPPERRCGAGFTRSRPPRPTPVFDTYWRFAAERQRVFHRRVQSLGPPWSDDPILQRYKFTNAYRASDRVSQYLIRNVIYDRERSFRDTFLRVLLFKIFNRIGTWEILRAALGEELTESSFDVRRVDQVLEGEIAVRRPVYSAAYIMPTGGRRGVRKHRLHLELLARMLRDRAPERILCARDMRAAYEILLAYPTVGPFLAYQWVTDLNYAPHLEFNEMEFVMPGPGARDGLRKCFADFGDRSEGDLIRQTADTKDEHFARLGIVFQSLWGRSLQLIDCQNLFCEVDKYARVAHPEFTGLSGRLRIKQRFRPSPERVTPWYPPKWEINVHLPAPLP